MVTEEVIQTYKDKARTELKLSVTFAKDAQKELRVGNYRVAMAQALEAERHIQETRILLREINHLTEMEKTNFGVKRAITLAQEINEEDRKLEELEKQLTEVKEHAAKEKAPETTTEEEKYDIRV